LRRAAAEGVEVYAYSSEFLGREIKIKERVEVDLG
jgi:DNA-binding sugar fermentation-stimulating protein